MKAVVYTLTLALAIVSVAMALTIKELSSQGNQAERTHAALCVFVRDLKIRYDNGIRFLVEHPNGIPGISAEDLRTSINNQRRTINALKGLNCDGS